MPEERSSKERSGQVQSLVRALRLLTVVSRADDGLTLTEAAQRAELPVSSAHRLLSTLQQERFVRFDQERTRWFVGVAAFVAGSGFLRSRDLVTVARPYMRLLMEDSGETVSLAVEETGIGRVHYKVLKNIHGSEGVWNSIKDERTVGIVKKDEGTGV